MNKDFYELVERLISGECTKLNTYICSHHTDNTEIKVPVQPELLANWILLNKEFLLKVLNDYDSLNNEINDLNNKIDELYDEITVLAEKYINLKYNSPY